VICHFVVIVLSFGIVLWEIWSRQLPFDEFHFATIFYMKQAVREGTRPTVKDNWPEEYVALVRDCWSGSATYRPTFQQIVERLENLSETHLLHEKGDNRSIN
jgi:hypothetical protein